MNGTVVAFRMAPAEYERLKAYAEANGMNVSDTVRRAVKWMLLLSQGRGQ